MRKFWIFALSLIFIFSSVSCSCKDDVELVKLEDAQYGDGGVEYLETYDKIKEKFASKSNFVFYMYGATCSGCHKFTPILREYVEEVGINIYAIEVNQVLKENRDLAMTLKGTPAVGLVKEGELYSYISGMVEGQAEYFKSKDGLKVWFDDNIKFE